ncbi:Mg2+ transporter protein, CorA-like/Zinc transport protein ZntB [Penicillium expansum]|uniref:Mg2+ transporter protein, CorA-like/Zinc transport protein ZntB n=1 Tax=Penicillium expansum TaxID=27334 RepID=A0A0A2JWY1_PENEN|nr:Mg2+ transporter protein, CorA-like/Zinc transport protein ZntB [Penicillium expansum]KGO36019.1 Mg2+ transporter protein, CorA-like/Zinc transport protein ZntB [Penicillium expansum]KGO39866.1 Mg2+ transporter protein, CorA-like/Zinc transport protein ZntB [Penicillium expansum]KGO59341.1 Mg2+ transporter protein, CorA-like/Zinc transport protein ZntB [Penicillium expansum]
MLDLLVAGHEIGPSFWAIPSCFYQRSDDLEGVFCLPFTESCSGSINEISYTIRYPEYRLQEDRWVIRQTGIYHRYDKTSSQSLFVLFNPTPQSQAHSQAENLLRNFCPEIESDPFWLHRLLFETYFPAWRKYIAIHEQRFLPLAGSTIATFISGPLAVGYDTLRTLTALQTRFLEVPAILKSATDILDELCNVSSSRSGVSTNYPGVHYFKNHRRECIAISHNASHLQQRAQIVSKLLADTLLLRDQVLAKEQNANMLQLNKSAVFITTLSLVYLPSSFLATIFGMNFFDMDEANNRIVGTPMIWIFFVSAAALTAVTFLLYYWLLRRDSATLRALAPKIQRSQTWTIEGVRRRFTGGGGANPSIELQAC